MSQTLTTPKPSSKVAPKQRENPLATRSEFGELLSRFWNGDQKGWFAEAFGPSTDLIEEDNRFQLKMDIPGVEAKDINVQVQGNTVTVSGERSEEKEEKGQTFHRLERRSGSFSRTLTLPCEVSPDEAAAEYTQGVLTLTLPKCEKSKAAKIEVKS
jgi:HSP20 family protein